MRGYHRLVVAGLLVVATVSTEAAAQDTPSWHRLANPDGAFSVEMPCNKGSVQEQEDDGSVGMACWQGSLVIGAVTTTDGLGEGGPDAAADFEAMLAEARNDPNSERVEVLPSTDARMFRVWKNSDAPFGIAQMIEFRPGKMVVLAVMENPEGAPSSIDRTAAEQMAFRYFDSFQVAAK